MYNTNVFQQGLQQQMLQVPFDRLVANQLQGQAPNLVGLQITGNLLPWAGHLIAQAITEIQGGLNQSAARIYFFNLMAGNNYDNVMFRQLVSELANYVELMCVVNSAQPQQIIPQATSAFITYKVAQAALNNPLLVQQMGNQTAMAMQRTVADFAGQMQAIQQQLGQRQQQQGGMMPNMGGSMMPNQGGMMAGAPGFGGGGMGGGMGMGMNMNMGGGLMAGTPGFGSSQASGIFTNTNTTAAQGVQNGPMSLPSATAGAYQDPNQQMQAAPPPSSTAQVATFTQAGGNTMLLATGSGTTLNEQASAPAPAPAPATQEKVEAHVVMVGDMKTVTWLRSNKYPLLPTFDPNKEELKFHVYSDETIQPLISQRSPVDRTKHLAPISITPQVVALSQQLVLNNPASDHQDANQVIEPDQIQEIQYPGGPSFHATHKESWNRAEAHLLSVRSKYPEKFGLVIKYGMLVDTLIASPKIEALLRNLTGTKNPQEAVTLIKAAHQTASFEQNNRDLRAISTIITRLTQRVNRFVSVDMSLTLGRIDGYMEDAPALANFLKDRQGSAVSEVLEAAHQRIVDEALNLAEEALAQIINENEFDDSPIPESEKVEFLHLYSKIAYAVGDFSTIELRAEIPNAGYSVLISESSTPLLADLAKRVMSKKSSSAKFGSGIEAERFLLRTNDGVVLEFAKGAFSGDGIVVAVAGGTS